MTDNEVIDQILLREGGYVDNPADRGGPTNWGITQATLAAHRGHPVMPSDVRALAQEEARQIYQESYVAPFSAIPDPFLRGLMVDMAVNHGEKQAVRILQTALGVTIDGVLGPVTLAALTAHGTRSVLAAATAQRARFYGQIIAHDHSQAAFAGGWMNRLAEFIEALA